jgi:hypothetical protein
LLRRTRQNRHRVAAHELLARSLATQHDAANFARDLRATTTGREESKMLERVLSLQHSTIALGEKPGVYAPSGQHKGFGSLKDAILRLLRKLGEFLAAGGPLS